MILSACQSAPSYQERTAAKRTFAPELEIQRQEFSSLLSSIISEMNGHENRVSVCMKISRLEGLARQMAAKGALKEAKPFRNNSIQDYCLYKTNINPAASSQSMLRAKSQFLQIKQKYLNGTI
jgi:hypothetical protein